MDSALWPPATQAAINAAKYRLDYWDDPDSSTWDILWLGRDRMPGIWEVVSGECMREIDHKKSKDKDGAHVHDLGVKPGKFAALGRMISRDDWVELQRVLPALNPRSNGGLKSAVSIYHPAVALLGISTVYVTRITAPTIESGILKIAIDLIEWSEPKAVKTAPTVAAPGESDDDWNKRAEADLAAQKAYFDMLNGAPGSQFGLDLQVTTHKGNADGSWRDLNKPAEVKPPSADVVTKGPTPWRGPSAPSE